MSPVLTYHPGAEVYLKYFSTDWQINEKISERLFLRSSPELYLKSLLIDGAEKIFELGPCFRNGIEFGDWHHPEFLMLEYYQKDISFFDFMTLTSELIISVIDGLKEFTPVLQSTKVRNAKKYSFYEIFEHLMGFELIDNDVELSKKISPKLCPSVKIDDDFNTAIFKVLMEVFEPHFSQDEVVFLYDYPPSQAALSKIENQVSKRFECYIYGVEICNAFLELTAANENKIRIKNINNERVKIGLEPIDYTKPVEHILCTKDLPGSCGNALGVDRLISVLFKNNDINAFRPRSGMNPYR